MIPNNTKRGKVDNQLGAVRSRKLTVDAANMQHIMGLLTKAYGDNELAVLREYSTNGWDAQIDAGVTTPIRVSTPTELAPFLKIKDNGTGISADDLLDMYTMFGASTKREQKTTNGSMGIGCKSGLAYGDQFSIVSVKDGWKTTASVSRAEDDSALMEIINEEETTEPNGTEIIIPAGKYHRFDEKAQNLFKFWAPGTVLINGKEPNRDDLEKMTDRIYFHGGPSDIIVMGNVPYPLDYEHTITHKGRKTATFVTMNGDDEVVFMPSREGLIYNGITTNVVLGIREEFTAKIKEFIKTEVEGAKTYLEAYRLIRQFNDTYGKTFTKDISFKGLDFADKEFTYETVASDGTKLTRHYSYISWMPRRERNSVSTHNDLNMHVLDSAKMIVVGYTGNGIASGHKTRLRSYMNSKGIQTSGWDNVVFIRQDFLPEQTMTDGFTVHNWKTIMAETKNVIQYNRGGSGFSYGGRYDVYSAASGDWTIDAVDSKTEIYFFSEKEVSFNPDVAARVLKENPDVVFIKAPTNRHAKLEREYPNAKPWTPHTWKQNFAKADFDALTEDDLRVLRAKIYLQDYSGRYNYTTRSYEGVYPGVEDVPEHFADQIEDPEYSAAVALYRTPSPVLNFASNDERYRKNREAAEKERKTTVEFSKRYPLMNWEEHPNDTLEYVNAMYAKNNKEN